MQPQVTLLQPRLTKALPPPTHRGGVWRACGSGGALRAARGGGRPAARRARGAANWCVCFLLGCCQQPSAYCEHCYMYAQIACLALQLCTIRISNTAAGHPQTQAATSTRSTPTVCRASPPWSAARRRRRQSSRRTARQTAARTLRQLPSTSGARVFVLWYGLRRRNSETVHREANGGAFPVTVAINLWCALGLCVACVACAVGGRTLLGENDPF